MSDDHRRGWKDDVSDLRTTAIADIIRRRLEGQQQDEDWAMQIALVAVPAVGAAIAAEIRAVHDQPDDRMNGPEWYAGLGFCEWLALGYPEDHEW